MLIDATLLVPDDVIETDVCIVGAGPAGLTLAREFLGRDVRVCVLESGGLQPADPETAQLSEVETTGEFLQIKPDSRSRQFGGNSSSWGVDLPGGKLGLRHRPLDEVDFEKRDWIPHSGWPFNRDHLMPYYERAQRTFGMERFAYEACDWEDADHSRLPFGGDRITTRMFQFSLGKLFFDDYREEVRRSANVTAYLHATVVELETDDTGGTVTRVRVACSPEHQFWVRARYFVLATGGVEGAQLLLQSNRVNRQGLGNDHDLVGRFFMDHPMVYGGLFIPSSPRIFSQARLYDLRSVNGSYVMGTLGFTDEAMRREHLTNISASIFPRSKYYVRSPAKSALAQLLTLRAFKSHVALQQTKSMLTGVNELADLLYGRATRRPEPQWYNFFLGGWSTEQERRHETYHLFEVVHQTEQLPDPDNRVRLSDDRDRLGRQRVRVESRWRRADIEGIQRAQRVLAEEIARAGLGRFKIFRDGDRPLLGDGGTAHHMGTTRMHADPKQGVVDPACRVHGVANLFVASSSVFPTGGYANPTLTIAALAIRIADRLKVELRL